MSHIAAPAPFSFELYPARAETGVAQVERAATVLAESGPGFISVTYGAGGSTTDRSVGLLRHIHRQTPARAVAHLTSVGASRDVLVERIEQMLAIGVRDFLALRGDAPAGGTPRSAGADGVGGSAELTRLIHAVARRAGLTASVAVAAYPNGHGRSRDPRGDIRALLEKQDAGAAFALTQVVFSAPTYGRFLEEARNAGVTIPIVPGIMPVASLARLARIAELTGVDAPPDQALELAIEPDPERRGEIAVRRAAGLAAGLLQEGAPALHFFAFNRHDEVLRVLRTLGSLAAAPAV